MHFTDIFIRRPVLASVISLLILALGLRSLDLLPVLQYPRTENAVVTVSTTYTGADASLVAGFITTPLEHSIAQANGIDYMTSSSTLGRSTITANLTLNYDTGKALTEINTKVNAVLNKLPPDSQQPVISVEVGETIHSMYIGYESDTLPSNNITDYLTRVVQPQLQAVAGVQTAEILGEKLFALRVWLNPQQLAAYGLTAADVWSALAKNDYLSAVGRTKGQMVQVNLTASTNLVSLEEFRNLIVKQDNGAVVRLEDVGTVSLGAEDYDSQVYLDGKKAVYIGVKVAPAANLLDVIKRVHVVLKQIEGQLPEGINQSVGYDASRFVNSSINEVILSLTEALLIVTLVVFVFLGSFRSVLIPVIAIPLSLIGAFTFMLVLGFTINLLTLLALVLAIGLVVDDAIIIVENADRHLEEGKSPLEAAIFSARELAKPIVVMTIVLIAVFVPIGFMGGLSGALFTEFAFTLVGAVTISGIVALTLSPMMCSKFFKPLDSTQKGWQVHLVIWLDHKFQALSRLYERLLHGTLNYVAVTVTFACIVMVSIYFLYTGAKSELAPQEDLGIIITSSTAAPNSTLQQRHLYFQEIYQTFARHPETFGVFQIDVPGLIISGMVLNPWDERKKTASDLQPVVQQEVASVSGFNTVAFQPPSLPGSRGLPIQFSLLTTDPFERLDDVAENFLQEAQKSGMFMFLDSDLKYNLPESRLIIDRDMTSQLGLTMNDVGGALSAMLGGGYVNYFSLAGRSYKVIPQVQQQYRLNTDQLNNYYIRTASGKAVPVSTVVHIETKTVPQSLNHFQQQHAATLSGVPAPGVTQGQALAYLKDMADRMLPQGYSVDYAGQSRQFIQESTALMLTFFFALIIIFLVLAAQFESFRDPIIILITVPLSICGALIFISLGVGGASINIYTQVGLVTLVGLISKHGILIVEFANNLQRQGHSKRQAIEDAAAIRLRPILMTTAAMVLGVVPLITASGAGAASRYNLGLVIATGVGIGTFFTLFVVPAMYMLLATDHAKQKTKQDETGEVISNPHA
jgi:multidrug efflux pump